MPKQKLTDVFIRNVKVDDRTDFIDTQTDGLILRVSTTGKKVFQYRYYNLEGKKRRIQLGTYPALSLQDARKETMSVMASVANYKDPAQEKAELKSNTKQALIEVVTFNDLADLFIKRHLPPLRPRTSAEYERIINTELRPVFGQQSVDSIKRRDVIELIDQIADDRGKPRMANLVRAVLSKIFSFGSEREFVNTNPVIGTKQKAAGRTKRDRVYSDEEIRIIWHAFEQQAEPIRTYLKMLLLLGQRRTETARMKWADVDLAKRTWVIPETDTKGKRKHTIALPGLAIEMLSQLHQLTGHATYVFKSPKGDQPLRWVQQMIYRVREITLDDKNVPDFKIHDLRRTAASNMAALGVERTVLGKLLNHAGLSGDDQVTAIYDRHDYLNEMQDALERWSHQLSAIVTGETQEARIIKMKSRV